MKSLLDENDRYTWEGVNCLDELSDTLAPIVRRYVKDGYSIRQVCHLAVTAAFEVESKLVLEIEKR